MSGKHHSFSEIAPLYALGLLDQETCRWVEAMAAADPDLATEVAKLQALANTVPPGAASPAASVKAHLLNQLGLAG
jgi:anti-sigma-K factor RskA